MALALACDFDHTLFFRELPGHYRDADLDAIRRFQAAGNLFGAATGRSLVGLLAESEPQVRYDFYVLATGALVLSGDRSVLRRHCVGQEAIERAYERCSALGPAVIHANDTVYGLGKPMPMVTKVGSVKEAGPHYYGLSVYVGDERAPRLAAEIDEEFAGVLSAYANKGVVDVGPAGCSKGEGVSFAKEALGVPCMAAIGDSFNDVPMLDVADVSYTFDRSPAAVQRHATAVVSTLAEAIDDLMARQH